MRYSLVYGGIAGAIVITILSTVFALDAPSHFKSLWFGYLVMLTALSLIFIGVKRYRDVECGGVIRFGRGFALGLAMALVAALAYTIGWELYLILSGDDFIADYTRIVLEGMRAEGAAPAAIEAKASEMRDLAARYRDPFFRLPMTFVEIFPVGLLVALISAALLRNPRILPAMR